MQYQNEVLQEPTPTAEDFPLVFQGSGGIRPVVVLRHARPRRSLLGNILDGPSMSSFVVFLMVICNLVLFTIMTGVLKV